VRLNTSQIETLAALYLLQPATVSAVLNYLGKSLTSGSEPLLQLVRLGLAERKKWQPPDVEITEAMRAGLEEIPHGRTGKRPYLYQLTPAADAAGHYLHEALQIIEETTK